MMYGNNSNGYAYSPDRSRDVTHNNLQSRFIGANGNAQNGYYASNYSGYNTTKKTGWYDGAGRYHAE